MHSDWDEELRRGAAALDEMRRMAGPMLSVAAAAERLGLSSSDVERLAADRQIVAVRAETGEVTIPARQFRPGGRVREGIPAVLGAARDADPWVVLSILIAPSPLSGSGVVIDDLDDPATTEALVELMGTLGAQGAS